MKSIALFDDIIKLETLIPCIEKRYDVTLHHLSPKRIFFINTANDFCLYSPSSKYYKNDQKYWIDLTLKQKQIIEQYKTSIIVLRLENQKILQLSWEELKRLLTIQAMQYNAHELKHWKLYIHENYLTVGKSKKILACKIQSFQEWCKQ